MLNEYRSKESDKNKDQEENESEIKRLSSIVKSKEKERKKLEQELVTIGTIFLLSKNFKINFDFSLFIDWFQTKYYEITII